MLVNRFAPALFMQIFDYFPSLSELNMGGGLVSIVATNAYLGPPPSSLHIHGRLDH